MVHIFHDKRSKDRSKEDLRALVDVENDGRDRCSSVKLLSKPQPLLFPANTWRRSDRKTTFHVLAARDILRLRQSVVIITRYVLRLHGMHNYLRLFLTPPWRHILVYCLLVAFCADAGSTRSARRDP
eukprot:scaffold647872_cov45-Prasinocladus_malaysianus.AAC.1